MRKIMYSSICAQVGRCFGSTLSIMDKISLKSDLEEQMIQ